MFKRGYISVEAAIVAGVVTLLGIGVIIQSNISMASVIGSAVESVNDETVSIDTNVRYVTGGTIPVSTWGVYNGIQIRTLVSTANSERSPTQTLAINQEMFHTLPIGGSLTIRATTTGSLVTSGRVVWTIVSGENNIVIACESAPSDCGAITITPLRSGSSVVRVSTHNRALFIDIAITTP